MLDAADNRIEILYPDGDPQHSKIIFDCSLCLFMEIPWQCIPIFPLMLLTEKRKSKQTDKPTQMKHSPFDVGNKSL